MNIECSGIKNATTLDVAYENINDLEGIMYFTSLAELICNGNNLNYLINLPENLTLLVCDDNPIFSIASLPTSLTYISCINNRLHSLPSLPESLTRLDCSSNKLTSLPSLPANLTRLDCSSNQLTYLPSLPTSLTNLNCSSNELTSLPLLSTSMTLLGCSSNQLTSLPQLPSSLLTLSCGNNQLTNIPTLPTNLKGLFCNNNSLTTLPDFPASLSSLSCNGNNIFNIPPLPEGFFSLTCHDNINLKCLPYLPSTLSELFFNPNIIKCIPNKPVNLKYIYNCPLASCTISAPKLPNYPICNSVNNLSQCQSFPTVSGKVYLDSNKNGMYDNGENSRSNIIVQLSATNYAVTDANGNYSITSETLGAFTLQTLAPTHYAATPSTQAVTFTAYTDSVIQNIALQATETVDELNVDVVASQTPRPGFSNAYKVSYQNTGTTYLSPTASFYFDENLLTIDSISIPSTLGSGQVIVNLDTIVPGQTGAFWVYAHVKTTAPLGDTLYVSTHVLAKEIQATKMLASIIRGSFDPNDKQATPNLSPTQFSNGEYIDYTIRFQNTGTDTAFTVVIIDTLSSLLQNNSLQVVSSSHTVKTTVKNNIVSFEFLNIKLEDSLHNEKASHGYVHFKVLPKTTVTESDVISNRAAIYFDYNAPVITNKAYTSFTEPLIITATKDNLLNLQSFIYPNPAASKIIVSVSGNELLSLYNSTGSLVLKQNVSGTQEIDIENLKAGFYYYTLGAKNGKLEVK